MQNRRESRAKFGSVTELGGLALRLPGLWSIVGPRHARNGRQEIQTKCVRDLRKIGLNGSAHVPSQELSTRLAVIFSCALVRHARRATRRRVGVVPGRLPTRGRTIHPWPGVCGDSLSVRGHVNLLNYLLSIRSPVGSQTAKPGRSLRLARFGPTVQPSRRSTSGKSWAKSSLVGQAARAASRSAPCQFRSSSVSWA